MAYRYRRRYRKRGYRRRRVAWYNRKYSVAQLASKAIKGVNYLRGLVNSEKFKHDTAGSTSGITDSGTVFHLTNIGQGDGDGQRTGNSIFVRNVSIRARLTKSSSVNTTSVRVILFIDKQQIGDTPPGVSDVLSSAGTATSYLAHLNPNTVGRFTVLRSRVYSLTDDTPIRFFNWNVNLRHHVRYNGNLAADIQRGGIYLLVVSSVNSNGPDLIRTVRVSYHDN